MTESVDAGPGDAPAGASPDTEEARLQEVRRRLLRDGAAIGLAADIVQATTDRAAAAYADAPVRGFIGVLVERAVRAELSIPAIRP